MQKINVNEKIRVYVDDIEEWKVYEVVEVLEETKLGFRYLLKDLNGNTLQRIVDYSNTQQRFGARKVMDLNKPDWIIHYVFDNEKESVSIHTHGMDKYIERELEFTLPLESKIAMRYLNLICYHIVSGEVDVFDCQEIEGLFSCPLRVIKCNPNNDRENEKEVFRILFPDANMKFPGDKNCEKDYEMQIKDLK